MHARRWLTSIVALPLVVWLIHRGGVAFFLLMSSVCMVSLWEYFSIAFKGKPRHAVIIWTALILGFVMIAAAQIRAVDVILAILAINVLVCAALSVCVSKPDFSLLPTVCIQVLGMVYIPVFLTFLVMMRHQPHGAAWIVYVLCIIFSGDIGAFYVGTYWGRHKLIPRVSPGKTVEGAFGGLAANIALGSIINFFADRLPWGLDMPHIPWARAILFFLVVGAMGQLGDLFESQLKRSANMKDSGKILPGHGGILDRIDALLFAAPVAFIFKEYVF